MAFASGYFKTSYSADLALVETRSRWVCLILLIVGTVIFPFIASAFLLDIANQIFLHSLDRFDHPRVGDLIGHQIAIRIGQQIQGQVGSDHIVLEPRGLIRIGLQAKISFDDLRTDHSNSCPH